MEVSTKGYRCSYNTTEVENCPEDTDEATLLVFRRVREHKGTLSGPEQPCTNTENSTGCNHEGASMGVDVHGPETSLTGGERKYIR